METLSCFTPTKKVHSDKRRHSLAITTPSKSPREESHGINTTIKPSPRLSLCFEEDKTYEPNLLKDQDMKKFFSFRKSKSERELDVSEPLLTSQDETMISSTEEEDPPEGFTLTEFLQQDQLLHAESAAQSPPDDDRQVSTRRSQTITALPSIPTDMDLQAAAAATPLPITPQTERSKNEPTPRKRKRKNISLSLPMRSIKRVFTSRSSRGPVDLASSGGGLRRFYRNDEPEFEMLTPSNRPSASQPDQQPQQQHAQQRQPHTPQQPLRLNNPDSTAGPSDDASRSASGAGPSSNTNQPGSSDTNKQLPVLTDTSLQEVNNYAGAPTFAPPLPMPQLPNTTNIHANPGNLFVRRRAPTRTQLTSHITDLRNHIGDINLENRILRDQLSLTRRDWIDTAGALDLERHRLFEVEMERFRAEVKVEELEGEIRRLKRGSDLA